MFTSVVKNCAKYRRNSVAYTHADARDPQDCQYRQKPVARAVDVKAHGKALDLVTDVADGLVIAQTGDVCT